MTGAGIGRRFALWLGGILLALLVAAIVAATIIDWSVLKRPLQRWAGEAVGRQVAIGSLDLDLLPLPTLEVEDVRIANPEWAEHPDLVRAAHGALTLEPLPLLTGQVILRRVRLERAEVYLEVATDGRRSWSLGAGGQPTSPRAPLPVEIRTLALQDLRLGLQDHGDDRILEAALDSARLDASPTGLDLDATGRLQGRPFELQLQGGPLSRLLGGEAAYSLALEARSAESVVTASGSLGSLPELGDLDLRVSARIPEPQRWSGVAGQSIPALPVLELSGRLTHPSGRWQFADIHARLGESDLAGRLQVTRQAEPLRIEAQLSASRLDLRPVLAALRQAAESADETGPAIPRLPGLAARLQLDVATLRLPELALHRLSADLALQDRALHIHGLGLDLGGGQLTGEGRLTVGTDAVEARMSAQLEAVDLSQAATQLHVKAMPGMVSGQISAAVSGLPRSPAPSAATLLSSLHLADSEITYSRPDAATELVIEARTRPGESLPVHIDAEGTLEGRPLRAALRSAPLPGLVGDRSDYAVAAELWSRSAHARFRSRLGQLLEPRELSLSGWLEGQRTTDLEPWAGISLPALPPYRLEGELRRDGRRWQLRGLEAELGRSRLAGELTLSLEGRPAIQADIQASLLDLPQLLTAGEGDTTDEEDGMGTAAALRAADARLMLEAREVRLPEKRRLREVRLGASLEQGKLELEPLAMRVAYGRITGKARLDASQRPARGGLDLNLESVRVGTLASTFTLVEEHVGSATGEVHLDAVAAQGKLRDEVALPFLGRLSLDRTRLRLQDPEADTDLTLRFTTEGLAEGKQRTRIRGDGRYRGRSAALRFRGDPLLDLRNPEAPYALELDTRIGESQLSARGEVVRPFDLKGLDITLTLSGPNPERLYPVLGIPFPELPPYRLQGKVVHEGQRWMLSDLAGEVGDSDLAGELAIDASGERPRIISELRSTRLDLDDLAGLIGGAPEAGTGETASPEQAREAQEAAADRYVLPDDPFITDALHRVDAQVQYRGNEVQAAGLPLQELTMNVALEGGRLVLEPLDFGLGGGDVRLQVTVDAGPNPAEGDIDVEVAGINLRKALRNIDIASDSVGILGGRGKLWLKGDSLAGMLGAADGGIALMMTGGKLDALLVELAGLDAGEALFTWAGGRNAVPIDCAYADMQARAGRLRLDQFIIDSRDTTFRVAGDIDLDKERLDITISPRPKDLSLLAARSPLHIRGTLKDPNIDVGTEALTARGTATAALAALVGPAAALVPLLETGTGDESVYCRGWVEEIRKAAEGGESDAKTD